MKVKDTLPALVIATQCPATLYSSPLIGCKRNRMTDKTQAPGGSWASPLSTERIVGGILSLSEPRIEDEHCYWVEGRPRDAGRQVLVTRDAAGHTRELTPPPFSVRNRVHEYGGGAYVVAGQVVYFCNDGDNGLYSIQPDGRIEPLLVDARRRFADLVFDAIHQRLYCICESHLPGLAEPQASLVAIDPARPDSVTVVASGDDFYASPSVSHDGRQLAWISWSHPDMPWDRTRLWLADISPSAAISNARCVVDNMGSLFQPQWSPDHRLYFSSDHDRGWWNLYRLEDSKIVSVSPHPAEFGLPQWQFGMSVYGFLSAEHALCAYTSDGLWYLARLCTRTGELERIKSTATWFSGIRAVDGQAVLLAAGPDRMTEVVRYDNRTRSLQTVATSGNLEIDAADIAIGETADYPTADGSTAHGFFYAPRNGCYCLPQGTSPPLIVFSHGGPTAATSNAYNIKVQFWTTRGFAVLDVNYRGSTGYGRAYRQSLDGQWGVADVEDCVAGARWLAEQNKVNSSQLIIRGSSAGGYTTLCALTFHDVFSAGASLYGIGDLETLLRDTHKFESRYLDKLIGPYPEMQQVYRDRSPIHFVDQLNCPVIFLQGLEDKVVPPQQAAAMVQALRDNGIRVEYVTFEGEQHGFRRADTIRRAYEAELEFYGKVFGFTPAD